MASFKGQLRLAGASILPFLAVVWAQEARAQQAPPQQVPPQQIPNSDAPAAQNQPAPASSPVAEAAPSADTTQQGSPGSGGDKGIVVTGSRVARRGFETPTPMTSISTQQLQAKAATTMTSIIAEIPSLTPNQNVNNSTNVGQTNFNLRGIGANRTLVLLDGLRLEDTSPTGGLNANILPALLINRVEVVTGGASSAYGSDAITGVVNIGLNSKMEGGRIDVQSTVSNYGDDAEKTVSFAYGHSFANDRLHFVMAGSYFEQPDILYENARPWGRLGYARYTNTAANIAAGQPQNIIGPGGTVSYMTTGGVITSGPLKNSQFINGNTIVPFNPGGICGGVSYCQNGDGLKSYDTPAGVLLPKAKRYNFYGRLTGDVGASHIWFSGLYSYDKEAQTNVPNYDNSDITIHPDNVFLPASIASQLKGGTFTFARENLEDQSTYNTAVTTYMRLVAGADGPLPVLTGWNWDAHVAYTRDVYDTHAEHNRIQSNFFNGVDAIANPAVGGVAGVPVGAPVCRTAVTQHNTSCVPIDLFGPGAITPAMQAYYLGTSHVRAVLQQINAGVNVRGNLFDTWAGPISFAMGGEFRRDQLDQTSDAISQITGWRQASATPFSGNNDVEEGYAEAVIPLTIPNFTLMKKFEVDLAGRYANYKTSGTALVWKAGANYEINDSIRLRATFSHDFRAPSVNDLFSTPVANNGNTVVDKQPGSHFNESDTVLTITGGNPALKPETSNTLTYGIVLSPTFIPGLRLSADVYDIKMDNAITAFAIQDIVNNCYAGASQFCSSIVRDQNGKIIQVTASQFNAQVLKVHGIDFEAHYQLPFDKLGLPGIFTVDSLVSYVQHVKTIASGVVQENAGYLTGTNATPKWRAANTVMYTVGPLTLRSLVTVVGSGGYAAIYPTAQFINLYHFAARAYVDFSVQYQVNDRFQIYAKVNNAFNLFPPPIADNGTLKALYNSSQYYDSIGRVFGVGVRVKI
jgi:outer membrane receptor protein involved in Fe transport